MRLAIARAHMIGHAGVILVGDREYYERFGFSAESTGGLVMPAPVDRHRLLALALRPNRLADAAGLIVPTGEPVAAPAGLAV